MLGQSLCARITRKKPMTHKDQRHFEIEKRGAVLIVRVDGRPHASFGPEIADELEELVDRVDHDSRRVPGRRATDGA